LHPGSLPATQTGEQDPVQPFNPQLQHRFKKFCETNRHQIIFIYRFWFAVIHLSRFVICFFFENQGVMVCSMTLGDGVRLKLPLME
jgi:hypothetical protein